ncbi:uncharacterized protein LOC111611095 [Xiphophorus maculatus]|uniref:uncharacterized protein LOC111611095 n=1 Tax=Xiphophorus maculatus TaxID=8083 RepID=UPI000C6E3936|nr:uncharacterized protein LOC111611095 [Xiphophorus maculatus]
MKSSSGRLLMVKLKCLPSAPVRVNQSKWPTAFRKTTWRTIHQFVPPGFTFSLFPWQPASVSVLLLCGASASPVSLSVSPNLQQFFIGDSSVSLNCLHEGRTAEGWTVRGTGPAGDCGPPDSGSGPSCVLSLSGPSAGRFWCEASSGQRSDNVSITVLGKGLILEIPALPVRAGCDVTLRCRRSNGDITAAFFFVGQRRLGSGPELVLQPVRRADEGSYWCSTDRFGRSPLSLLRVTDPPLPHATTPPPLVSGPTRPSSSPPLLPPSSSPPLPQASGVSVPRLLCHLLVICPYCACSVLLLLRCCSRKSGGAPPPHLAFLAPPTGSQPTVAMETAQPAELDLVTTEHNF